MDLEDALCEVDTNCGKLGHRGLLCSGRQHPDYGAMRRRKQEPSTPSIEQALAKIKHWMRDAQKRTLEETWAPYRSPRHNHRATRMQQLLRKGWIRFRQNLKGSSPKRLRVTLERQSNGLSARAF
jgi:hypothetical protein